MGKYPISFPSPLYQGNTLSLLNLFTILVNFLTACKSLRRLRVLAGTSDLKNPDLYYLCTVGPNGHSYASSLNILKSTFLGFDIIVLMKKVKKLYLYFLFFLK